MKQTRTVRWKLFDAALPDGTAVAVFAQCDQREEQHFTGVVWQEDFSTYKYFTENNEVVQKEQSGYFLGQLKLTPITASNA